MRCVSKQTEADCEGGFLTFHDCVELRTLKTGETLTRNQRNNLRKRLATTARTIVQVWRFQLHQDTVSRLRRAGLGLASEWSVHDGLCPCCLSYPSLLPLY